MSHPIQHEVDPQTQPFHGRFEWILGPIDPLPEVPYIIVMANDHRSAAMAVRETVKNGVGADIIRRRHLTLIDVEIHVEDFVIEGHSKHLAFWKNVVEIAAQIFQVAISVKVIDHEEAAAVDVLAKVGGFLVGQVHLTRLGNVREWVIKQLLTAQLYDAV